jgi:hypothetical protein
MRRLMMRTLGVDLASQAKKTALCEIVWRDGTAVVSSVRVGVTDAEILNHARTLDLAREGVSSGPESRWWSCTAD